MAIINRNNHKHLIAKEIHHRGFVARVMYTNKMTWFTGRRTWIQKKKIGRKINDKPRRRIQRWNYYTFVLICNTWPFLASINHANYHTIPTFCWGTQICLFEEINKIKGVYTNDMKVKFISRIALDKNTEWWSHHFSHVTSM